MTFTFFVDMKRFLLRFYFLMLSILGSHLSMAQVDTTTYDFGDFGGIVYLDSLVVTATRSGFNVDDFVSMVRNDESFYLAFRNLRFLSYLSENDIEMFAKNGEAKAHYQSKTQQLAEGLCREMNVLDTEVEGKFYKRKGDYKYYTAKLYDRLFFTPKRHCETSRAVGKENAAKGMSKHVQELKKLIFKPGSKADIPIIGNRTAIFDPEMAPYYDFKISSRQYRAGQDCYVFTAVVKEAFQEKKKDKTVIKFLETYFDKSTFQVIARNYQLAYSGALFDFDVKMEIELIQLNGEYAPEYIRYDGFWDVPGKKPEISKFSTRFYEFK